MEHGTSLPSSGSVRIEGFQVPKSALSSLVVAPAAKKPAVENPFSRLLKAESAPNGLGLGGLKVKVPKLPPRPLKTALSVAAGEAAQPGATSTALRSAQSCDVGRATSSLSPACSAPVPVPVGSCRSRSSMCDSTLEELCAAWAGDASALEALAPAVRGSLTSLPLGARSTLTSLRSTPPATVAGSQSSCSCSTAGGHTMMSSSSSPYTVASAGRSSSGFGSAAGIECERELWETRAEAVTYAVQLRSLEHLTKRGHEHMRTIEEERDLLRRENAELRAAIGRSAAPAALADDSSAMDFAPTFPLDADVPTPRLPAAETVPMETCGAPARRSFESLCFVAAAPARNPLSGLGF